MKKLSVLLAIILLLTVPFVSCGSKAAESKHQKVVRIGFPGTKSVLFGAPGIAQSKGYFEEELEKLGYKVEYKAFAAAGPAVNEALAAGEVDIVIYADVPGIVSKANGIETSLIGIYDDFINAAILVLPDSNINSVSDLKGKTIGFTKGTYMHKYILGILEKNSININDVNLVNTSEGASILQSGTIDALVTTDGNEAISVVTQKIAKTIDTTKSTPELSGEGIIIARNDFLSNNEDAAVAVLKAIEKGKDYFVKNPDEGYNILTNTGINYEASKSLYNKDSEKFDYITIGVDDNSIKKLEDTKKFLLDNNLIKNDFDINQWVNKDIYEKSIK